MKLPSSLPFRFSSYFQWINCLLPPAKSFKGYSIPFFFFFSIWTNFHSFCFLLTCIHCRVCLCDRGFYFVICVRSLGHSFFSFLFSSSLFIAAPLHFYSPVLYPLVIKLPPSEWYSELAIPLISIIIPFFSVSLTLFCSDPVTNKMN